jgi:uncharacterized protein (DUF58 family)
MSEISSRLVSPAALMAIQNLELRARIVVEGFWSGLHRSPYHGFSVEFSEYRPYSPGDDPRYLDWKLYARSDRTYVKRFQDETNLRAYLLVDHSRSMDFGSVGYTKREYAATLAATLSCFLHTQGDAVGLLRFDEELRDWLPARHRSGHLRQLFHHLEQPAAGQATNLETPLRRMLELVRRRSLMILISDLLSALDELAQPLAALTACGHEVLVFQVLDPAELAFGFETPAQFQDLETGRTVFVDPPAGRKAYQDRLHAHLEKIDRICGQAGVSCHRFATDQSLELALFDFLSERMRATQGGKARRRSGEGRR